MADTLGQADHARALDELIIAAGLESLYLQLKPEAFKGGVILTKQAMMQTTRWPCLLDPIAFIALLGTGKPFTLIPPPQAAPQPRPGRIQLHRA